MLFIVIWDYIKGLLTFIKELLIFIKDLTIYHFLRIVYFVRYIIFMTFDIIIILIRDVFIEAIKVICEELYIFALLKYLWRKLKFRYDIIRYKFFSLPDSTRVFISCIVLFFLSIAFLLIGYYFVDLTNYESSLISDKLICEKEVSTNNCKNLENITNKKEKIIYSKEQTKMTVWELIKDPLFIFLIWGTAKLMGVA